MVLQLNISRNWYAIVNNESNYFHFNELIIGTVFANGPEDLGLITGRVIPKTQEMVLDATLLNTQHYKVRIKGSGEIQEKE